jgi:N-methylhydantoinase B
MLIYRTAGGGGWKDPFDRPQEKVEADVAKGLVSAAKAESDYGVVLGDAEATAVLREQKRVERGTVKDFDLGPSLGEILASAKAETGLEPPDTPKPLPWAAMESDEEARARVRAQDES